MPLNKETKPIKYAFMYFKLSVGWVTFGDIINVFVNSGDGVHVCVHVCARAIRFICDWICNLTDVCVNKRGREVFWDEAECDRICIKCLIGWVRV